MRTLGLTLSLALAVFVISSNNIQAGERLPNVASLPVGFRYCPAPGADNSDFNSSYYAIDAKTGQMSRYVDGQPRQDLEPVDTEEKLLFVAPTVNVENRYVPYPGAAPQQAPAEFANSYNGDNDTYMRQQAPQPQYQPPYPQQMQQPRPGEEYAHYGPRPDPNAKRPWWKKMLR